MTSSPHNEHDSILHDTMREKILERILPSIPTVSLHNKHITITTKETTRDGRHRVVTALGLGVWAAIDYLVSRHKYRVTITSA